MLTAPVLRKTTQLRKHQHPILDEDIEKGELFEDAWLKDREASLVQCVNGLLKK